MQLKPLTSHDDQKQAEPEKALHFELERLLNVRSNRIDTSIQQFDRLLYSKCWSDFVHFAWVSSLIVCPIVSRRVCFWIVIWLVPCIDPKYPPAWFVTGGVSFVQCFEMPCVVNCGQQGCSEPQFLRSSNLNRLGTSPVDRKEDNLKTFIIASNESKQEWVVEGEF